MKKILLVLLIPFMLLESNAGNIRTDTIHLTLNDSNVITPEKKKMILESIAGFSKDMIKTYAEIDDTDNIAYHNCSAIL